MNWQFTYHFFDNVDEYLNVPRMWLRTIVLIFPIAPDTASWSGDRLQKEESHQSVIKIGVWATVSTFVQYHGIESTHIWKQVKKIRSKAGKPGFW